MIMAIPMMLHKPGVLNRLTWLVLAPGIATLGLVSMFYIFIALGWLATRPFGVSLGQNTYCALGSGVAIIIVILIWIIRSLYLWVRWGSVINTQIIQERLAAKEGKIF